jgi:CubicO group peptidase (beta-lactamase class C family)
MTNGETLEQIVEAAVAQGQAPGVVAAVAHGDETYVTAAGAMAVDGPPMREDTVFRISSVTKPITAVVILGLIEDGRLSLDEPVDRLLPELAGRRVLRRPDGPLDDTVEAERPVTVRDLLTFTWGFGMQGAMFSGSEPWPVVAAAGERELASFGPGARRAGRAGRRRAVRRGHAGPRAGAAGHARHRVLRGGPGPAGHRVREPQRPARRHRPAGRGVVAIAAVPRTAPAGWYPRRPTCSRSAGRCSAAAVPCSRRRLSLR